MLFKVAGLKIVNYMHVPIGGLALPVFLTHLIFSRPMCTFRHKRKRSDLLKDLTDELLCVFRLKRSLKRGQKTERRKALNYLRMLSVTWKVCCSTFFLNVKWSITNFSHHYPNNLEQVCWENKGSHQLHCRIYMYMYSLVSTVKHY